jgi:DNA helicase HerA-like ATPase
MLQSPNEDEHSFLVLGWQVTRDGHPIYWLKKDAEIGHHQDSDLVRVFSADRMDNHTIIVAQSGSGKSFFPGRLIQELLMRTLCRCLIFDPNGDFSRMDQLYQDVWQGSSYDPISSNELLPDETNADFAPSWRAIQPRVRTRRHQAGRMKEESPDVR